MKTRALVIITSDPRSSPRPAEAVRIAAGVGVWEKVEVTLYLRGAALRMLDEFPDELVDGENFQRYLPLLTAKGRPVLVQRGAVSAAELGEPSVKFEEIDDAQLAARAAQCQCVLRF